MKIKYVLLQDADLELDLEDSKELYDIIRNNSDIKCIFGSRYLSGKLKKNNYFFNQLVANLNSIMDSIRHKVDAINRIAHTGAIRTTKTQVSSGIALQTEFELLNARLSEKADNLEIAEEQLFRCYAMFQNVDFDGEINYPDSFNIKDYAMDLQFFSMAKAMNIESPTFNKEIDKEIIRSVLDDDEKLNQAFDEVDGQAEVGQFSQDEVQEEDVEQEEV